MFYSTIAMPLFFQIALGPSGKAKRYCMKSGTREQFEENLVNQFPSEKIAISKLMKIVDVRECVTYSVLMLTFLLLLSRYNVLHR